MVTWALATNVVASTAGSKKCLFLFIVYSLGLFLFCCLLFAGSMKPQLLEFAPLLRFIHSRKSTQNTRKRGGQNGEYSVKGGFSAENPPFYPL